MGIFDRVIRDKEAAIVLTSPLLGTSSHHDDDAHLCNHDDASEKPHHYYGKSSSSLFNRIIRARSILYLLIGVLAILLIFFTLPHDVSPSSYAPKLELPSLPSLPLEEIKDNLKWLSGSTSSSSSSSSSSSINSHPLALDRSWDYYAQNGVFISAREDNTIPQHRRARFVHLDKIDELRENGKSGLEGSVKLGDGFDEITKYIEAVNNGKKTALDSLSYLQNKTVLLIGDSIDRFSLDFVCTSMLSKSYVTYRQLHKEPHNLGWIDHANGLDEFSEPHKCTLPSSHFPNTSIWSLMVYGVTSESNEWKHKEQTRNPRKYDDKIRLFAKAFNELQGGKKPDLIIVNTVLWDLATANLRDAIEEKPAQDQLSFDFLHEFREKTIHLMDLIQELWPEAAKMYRPNHAMKQNSDGVWFLQGLNPRPKGISRSPYSPNKVLQLNQIVDDLLANQTNLERPFWPFDLRHATQEYVYDFPDSVHTGSMGRTIYGQLLMYYIKMLT